MAPSIKIWLHVSKKVQKKRLIKLGSSAATRWRVTKGDWARHERYDAYRRTCERALRETSTGAAPWTVIDAADAHFRDVSTASYGARPHSPRGKDRDAHEALREAIRRLDRARSTACPPPFAAIDTWGAYVAGLRERRRDEVKSKPRRVRVPETLTGPVPENLAGR